MSQRGEARLLSGTKAPLFVVVVARLKPCPPKTIYEITSQYAHLEKGAEAAMALLNRMIAGSSSAPMTTDLIRSRSAQTVAPVATKMSVTRLVFSAPNRARFATISTTSAPKPSIHRTTGRRVRGTAPAIACRYLRDCHVQREVPDAD
jgi:hypothetical protein